MYCDSEGEVFMFGYGDRDIVAVLFIFWDREFLFVLFLWIEL